ncbi:MAG: hypothetical protein ABJB66_12045 [Gemmatimonadaceae bacterium]
MAGLGRIIRGAIGTGLTFAVGVGAAVTAIGTATVLFGNNSFEETFRAAGKFTVVSFILGVAFSGMLAISARRGWLAKLTVARVAIVGASAGLLYFLLISLNAYKVWSVQTAVMNFILLTVLGAGAATATLFLARLGRGELNAGMKNSLDSAAEPRALNEGPGITTTFSRKEVAEKESR